MCAFYCDAGPAAAAAGAAGGRGRRLPMTRLTYRAAGSTTSKGSRLHCSPRSAADAIARGNSLCRYAASPSTSVGSASPDTNARHWYTVAPRGREYGAPRATRSPPLGPTLRNHGLAARRPPPPSEGRHCHAVGCSVTDAGGGCECAGVNAMLPGCTPPWCPWGATRGENCAACAASATAVASKSAWRAVAKYTLAPSATSGGKERCDPAFRRISCFRIADRCGRRYADSPSTSAGKYCPRSRASHWYRDTARRRFPRSADDTVTPPRDPTPKYHSFSTRRVPCALDGRHCGFHALLVGCLLCCGGRVLPSAMLECAAPRSFCVGHNECSVGLFAMQTARSVGGCARIRVLYLWTTRAAK